MAEGVVGGLQEAGVDEIVRVKDAESVVVHVQKLPKGKAQHVALAADPLRAGQNARAGGGGYVRGIVPVSYTHLDRAQGGAGRQDAQGIRR